jgi:hypothetical protein
LPERGSLQVLDERADVAVHDRFRQPGRAGGEEDPQRMVCLDAGEREVVGGNRRPCEEGVVPAQCPLDRRRRSVGPQIRQPHDLAHRGQLAQDRADLLTAIEVLATEAVAVGDQQQRRFDLREAIDDGARAELRRRRRPHRADRGDGEHRDDRLREIRKIRGDPFAGLHAECAQPRRHRAYLSGQFVPGRRRERAQLGAVDERDLVGRGAFRAAQRVLGVVDARAGEPDRARHGAPIDDLRVRRLGADLEEVPDRAPKALEVAHRPAPEFVVRIDVNVALGGQPAHELCDLTGLDCRGVRRPQERAFDHREPDLAWGERGCVTSPSPPSRAAPTSRRPTSSAPSSTMG